MSGSDRLKKSGRRVLQGSCFLLAIATSSIAHAYMTDPELRLLHENRQTLEEQFLSATNPPPANKPSTIVALSNIAPELFPVPHPLKKAVDFWEDIFLRHNSHTIVFHDRIYPHVIWKVLNLAADEHHRDKRRATRTYVQKQTQELQQRLARLGHDPTPQDAEDKRLLAVVQNSQIPDLLTDAASRLRSQRGVADEFQNALARAKKLLPQVRQILRSEGIPPEVAMLPFVETMYNTRARSAVGALGLWQLMPQTARGFGLRVSKRRDDRKDIAHATRAAARILKTNYRVLGSWPLAITAYNHGCYGMQRAMAETGSEDLVYLIQHYQRDTWGFSSKNFYAEFLAALKIMENLPHNTPHGKP